MTVTAKPEMLRAGLAASDQSIGVDRESRVIRGYVVAQLGEFKDKRGTFDEGSLDRIVELGNADPRGLRSRLNHPNESDDGLTKHLGRSKNFRRDDDKVRADLYLAEIAMQEPVGGGKPLGQYVMDLAVEDPGALSSSLVLRSEKIERKGAYGRELPSLWMPTQLLASDIVADGDAVHGDLLSSEGLESFMEGSERRIPTKLAVAATEYLDQMFPNADRQVVQTRMLGFVNRYLSTRFEGAPEESVDTEIQSALDANQKRIEALAAQTNERLDKLTDMIEKQEIARKQELSAQQRSAEIAALCNMAGVPDLAAKMIANDALSVDGAREQLFKIVCERNAPPNDDAAGEAGKLSADSDSKYRKEFEEHRKVHDQLGVTVDKYIARRKKEDGIAA